MKNFIKKIISATIGLLIICLLICTPISVYAATSGMCGPRGAYWDFDFNSHTLTITGTGEMFDFESIRPEWYSKRTSLYHIVIEEGITSIGKNAFDGLEYVKTVTLPDTIEQIGDYAFRYCESITSIDIGDKCETIGNGAFQRCYSLESVILSGKLKSIGESAFHFNEKLTNITLPKSLLTIGEDAFMTCSSLYSITIPEKVTEIPKAAFKDCSNLTSVVLGANIETIASFAFYNCKSLNNITIPSLVKTIGASAFYHCDNLRNVIIPHSVETISTSAFAYCKNLSSIVISNSTTEIPYQCFYKCKKGITVILPPTVTAIDEDAFEDSSPVLKGEKNSYAKTYADARGYDFVELKSYKITYNANGGEKAPPIQTKFENIDTKLYNSVPTRDGYKCLGWATSNTAVSPTYLAGATVSSNQNLTLYAVWGLKELYPEILANGICGENLKWTFDDSGLLAISGIGDMTHYTSKKDFPWYDYAEEIKNVEIYSGVTSVSDYAFHEYPNLISATIGKNSTSANKSTMVLEESVFYGCANLTTVTIKDSLKSIGNNAFDSCVNLKNVNLGNGLLSIDEEAFRNCTTLQTITIPDSVTAIGMNLFENCKNLSQVIIGKGIVSIPKQTFRNNTSLSDIIIPDNVMNIGSGAFSGCKNLINITIPANVNTIGTAPFKKCTNLQSIEVDSKNKYYLSENGVLFDKSKTRLIQYPAGKKGDYTVPDGIISICQASFDNCSGLVNLKLNTELKYIEAEAFASCCNITSLIIPYGVLNIGDFAFEACSQLSAINIPNSVTSLGSDAFTYCKNLQTVVIGSGITEIKEYTFDSCSSLRSVVVYPTSISIASTTFADCSAALVIKGESGSYAETFAKANNLTFESLDTYTITYNANGGNNTPSQQVKFYNIDNNISHIVPNKTEYSFVGWSAKSNSTTAEYFPRDSISVNENTTLYAVWSPLYPENITPSMSNVTLFVGDSEQVNISIEPDTVPNKKIVWKSNNLDIATVNNGLITAISPGNTTIVATSENEKTATITVNVMEVKNSIDFSLSEINNSLSKSEIRITIDGSLADISSVKWAYGSQTKDYFDLNGTVLDVTMSAVPVSKNGIYTVYLKDIYGETTTKTINVSKIAIEQPFFENTSGYLEQENNLVIPIDFASVTENITVYTVLYDNGKLKDIRKNVYNPEDYVGVKDIPISYNLVYPKSGYELKAFVWNDNMMPLTNMVSVKSSKSSNEQIIEGNTDNFVYEFTVPETRSYTITSYTDSDKELIDLWGYLYDGENYITDNDNIGNGNYNFSFSVDLVAGTTYTLVVTNSEGAGDYLVVIE